MSKKSFSAAPKPKTTPLSPDVITAFERGGAGHDKPHKPSASQAKEKPAEEPTKRLSLDLPQSVHTRFKTACSATNRKMVGEVQQFIEQRTRELEKQAGISHK